MIEQKHLVKLKKFNNFSGNETNLKQNILCVIALGEKLAFGFSKNRKAMQALSGLRRYKFVRHTRQEGKDIFCLTPKGEAKLRGIIIDEIEIKNPNKWDGKWHLVMYDLPVRFKKARDAFRWKLKDLGFLQFQKSVWIYPYPCEEEILFVAEFFGVRKHLEILEVVKILNDKKFKVHFGL